MRSATSILALQAIQVNIITKDLNRTDKALLMPLAAPPGAQSRTLLTLPSYSRKAQGKLPKATLD